MSVRVAFATFLSLLSCCVAAFEVTPILLRSNIYFVKGETALGSSSNRNYVSNSAFVITQDSVVVIDALGSPNVAQALIRAIKAITDKPISHVFVTHYHADHVYGLQEFKKVGAKILAHKASSEYLFSETARLRLESSRQDMWPWINENTQLIHPDVTIESLIDLTIGGVNFRLMPAGPAHTLEDIVISIPAQGIFFTGDLVFNGRIPFVGQADSRHWIASLESLATQMPQLIAPGHGPSTENSLEAILFTKNYLKFLRDAMAPAARDLDPFDEAYAKTDWSAYKGLPLFEAANRMNAYNTYLLLEREN
jgi:glyoxylase-like metal-dependent hydrolase (beta-lactamase superfamily II)